MKIIHTADWHLGQMYNSVHSRDDDHRFFFDQLNKIVEEQLPDVIIVAGDVYDVSNPSIMAQTLFTEEILKLSQCSHGATIIVTGGNHDSRRSMVVNRDLWLMANVKVVGPLDRDADGHLNASTHVVPILKDHHVIGAVIVLPFFAPNELPRTGESPEENLHAELSRLRQVALDSYGNEIAVVGTAHISVGINRRLDDKTDIGGEYDFDTSAIPEEFDYMALGHIHNSEKHKGKKYRYAGSPLDMDFGENAYNHCVLSVDAVAGQAPVVETVALQQRRPMRDLTSVPIDVLSALKLARSTDMDSPAFVRILVKADGQDHSTINMELNTLFADTPIVFCGLHSVSSDEAAGMYNPEVESMNEFYELTPMKIATDFWESKNNAPMPDDLQALLQDVLDNLDQYSDDGKSLTDGSTNNLD